MTPPILYLKNRVYIKVLHGGSGTQQWRLTMAQQQSKGHVPPAPGPRRAVVVHVKLSAQERNALKAALSLEGSTMQEYFAAKVAERIQGPAARVPTPTDVRERVSPVHPTLAPGQTYRMPTGRYIHWCAVCGNLWRSSEAQPECCGQRRCHSLYWQTGIPAREGKQRRRGRPRRHSARRQACDPSKAEAKLVISSKDQLARDDDVR
jgi:hypothetical protein